uniref:Orn/DAP/Arg decarboxylase 2 N-terminal domain-containing protein n=1 Tax=Tetradesmus obliquus TaxID=3088 RepID=A0A383W8Q7_TETOB|eukprot:jgi/Sobl393_1/2022/SZX73394.1
MHASHSRRCAALSAAIAAGVFSDDTPSAMLMDLDQILATITHIQQEAGYPASTLHTVAVKANPVGKVLQQFRDRGMGAEAASLGELQQALQVGFPPERIVFDSPAKTRSELRFALSAGVAVNLDNFQELQRAADLLAAEPALIQQQQLIGLRINPQVGEGSIAALSTGGAVSKFGFPLQEARGELIAAFQAHPWLNMLHLHVGSQGLELGTTMAGVAAVWKLLQEIEAACGKGRVRVLDIGGGLSVDFASDDVPQETPFQKQARLLAASIPELFSPDCSVRLVTENGRLLLAKAGCVASVVEYTKSSGGRHIAVTHVGADLCMRACYMPDTWGLRVFVCDAKGRQKEGAAGVEEVVQDIAGPLCFQGDRLAVGRNMPKAEVGDYVLVADVGAYTLSMYSRYNSRCSPPVYGYTSTSAAAGAAAEGQVAAVVDSQVAAGGDAMQLELLRAGETLQQVLHFWNQLE